MKDNCDRSYLLAVQESKVLVYERLGMRLVIVRIR